MCSTRLWMALAIVSSAAVFPRAFATDVDASDGARSSKNQLATPSDEVTVTAKRLFDLEVQIHKAEDHFYDEYNRVNTIPEFQTSCGLRTDTATRMNYHICTPRFVDDATSFYARSLLQGEDVGEPILTISAMMPAYRKHVHEVADKDPALAKRAEDFLALTNRYAELHKRRFESRRIVVP